MIVVIPLVTVNVTSVLELGTPEEDLEATTAVLREASQKGAHKMNLKLMKVLGLNLKMVSQLHL